MLNYLYDYNYSAFSLGLNIRFLVSMEVKLGICFFSCRLAILGVLDWKSSATFLATLRNKITFFKNKVKAKIFIISNGLHQKQLTTDFIEDGLIIARKLMEL